MDRGPVTLTPVAERLPFEFSQLGFEQPTLRTRGKRSYRLRHRSGLFIMYLK